MRSLIELYTVSRPFESRPPVVSRTTGATIAEMAFTAVSVTG
jgi:hypothetical protein